jgi:co-chaperonin GroES (HSP10)
MKKKLRLVGDNILIKMDPDSDKTASGILFKPADALETILLTGVVAAVGPGKWAKRGDRNLSTRIPVGVEVGEGVVFNRFIASNTKSAEALHQFALDADEALIKAGDILLVYDRKEPINFG